MQLLILLKSKRTGFSILVGFSKTCVSCYVLELEFAELYSDDQFKSVDFLTRKSTSFETLMEKLLELRLFQEKTKQLSEYEYFNVGR